MVIKAFLESGDILIKILEDKIKSANLTKTERTIAEFILNNPEQSLFMTSTDLAAAIGISDSSIIRFTRSLGYSGFNDFKKDMHNNFNEMYMKKKDVFTSPLEKLEKNIPTLKESILLEQYFNKSLQNIKQTIEKNDTVKFDNSAKLLVNSRKKYICGFRGCSGLASWISLILGHMIPDVIETIESGSAVFEKLLDSNEKDVLVLFSLERYNQVGVDAIKLAKSNGAKIIVVTDKVTSPVAESTDILFIAPTDNLSFFNSHISSLFIGEVILNSVSKLIGAANEDRLRTLEKYIEPYGFY